MQFLINEISFSGEVEKVNPKKQIKEISNNIQGGVLDTHG